MEQNDETEMSQDPLLWHPGDVLLHKSGSVHVLKCRKEDDSGWWMLDHGGLADRALDAGDWVRVTPAFMRRAFSDALASC